jgi:ABC-type hemin transport system ATPase subunit
VVLNRGKIDCEGRPEQTITDEMLARVFAVETVGDHSSAPRAPFVLPQDMMAVSRLSA